MLFLYLPSLKGFIVTFSIEADNIPLSVSHDGENDTISFFFEEK